MTDDFGEKPPLTPTLHSTKKPAKTRPGKMRRNDARSGSSARSSSALRSRRSEKRPGRRNSRRSSRR